MSPEEIIRILMKSAAPERAEEVDALWASYHPGVFVVENKSGITLDATKDRIEFDPKTMEVFWLIGFSGWRAIECYAPHVLLSETCGKALHKLFDDDGELLAEGERTVEGERVGGRGALSARSRKATRDARGSGRGCACCAA